MGVRNGPGGYDMSSDFGEMPEQKREIRSKPKTTAKSPSQDQPTDLMATAMAMQKERES
jgi:hypothetical protein